MENGRFVFCSGATYDIHLRLIEKRAVDFLLVLTELFLPGVMAEALWANIGQTFRSWLRPPCVQCSTVKTNQRKYTKKPRKYT